MPTMTAISMRNARTPPTTPPINAKSGSETTLGGSTKISIEDDDCDSVDAVVDENAAVELRPLNVASRESVMVVAVVEVVLRGIATVPVSRVVLVVIVANVIGDVVVNVETFRKVVVVVVASVVAVKHKQFCLNEQSRLFASGADCRVL